MKSGLLFFIIILFDLSVFSQSNFAPVGAEWYYGFRENMQSSATGYLYYKSIKDTIIDNKQCKVIYKWKTHSDGSSVFEGADYLYPDTTNNRIFRYLFERFYLLYDFDKQSGDTLTIIEPYSITDCDSIKLVVDSVKVEIYSDSIYLKSLYTHQVFSSNYTVSFSGKMTEKIGNDYFFFPYDQLDCDAEGCPQFLRCYSDNKIAIKIGSTICDYVYTNTSKVTSFDELKIYPNPFYKIFTIEYQNINSLKTIEIKNIEGKKIYRNSVFNFPIQINLSNYPDGIYFIYFLNDEKISCKKIIKF